MKILAINASHRGDKGYTRFLIDLLMKGATNAGARCEVVTLAHLKINRCLGCEMCHAPERFFHCVYDEKDDVKSIFEKISGSDLIIYATPVYIFGMSSLLKMLLERMNAPCDTGQLCVSESGLLFHHIDRSICSKPFVPLVCCDNLEDETPKNVLAYFRTFSRFMDAPQVGTLVRNGGSLTGAGRDAEKIARFPKALAVYAAYEQAGRELALEGRICRSTERTANQEIIPVPLFHWVKQIKIKSIKNAFVKKAEQMMR